MDIKAKHIINLTILYVNIKHFIDITRQWRGTDLICIDITKNRSSELTSQRHYKN